jgi:putative transposase
VVALKKARSVVASGRGALIEAEYRSQLMELLKDGVHTGASIKAVANLFGICPRMLKRWGLAGNANALSVDSRKGSLRHEVHKLTVEERSRVIESVNDLRFADPTPAQIGTILAEERLYVGSESTVYHILREEGLLRHRGRARQPREPRPIPMLEARGIHQILALDITLLPVPVNGQLYFLYMVLDVWSRRILGT